MLGGGDPHFLEIQYQVPSDWRDLCRVSYRGRLQTWEGKIIPISQCLVWIDVAGEQLTIGGSRSNIAEAETITNTIIHLRTNEGNVPTTVPCFYLAQLALIRKNLSEVPDVEVSTVESYQTRVRERLFISLLNTKDVGFMNDIRRVNAALCRVRDELWLVGDRSFWVQQKDSCPAISALAQLAEEHDCIF
jgi:superfamily I DNA and/or RNA helicase